MDPIGASSTWRWYGYENSWVNIDEFAICFWWRTLWGRDCLFQLKITHVLDFFLNQGKWKEKQIISPEWIAAITPSPANLVMVICGG